ncbi:hypothetical protein ACN28S_57100 [Cystobacter fuscus]
MAVQYDPKIIAQHAEALYRRASRIVFTSAIMGLIVGAGALGVASNKSPSNTVLTLVGALLGALIGISIGRGRAFVYQLQAQQALCQVEIESNTRRATALTSAPPVKSD